MKRRQLVLLCREFYRQLGKMKQACGGDEALLKGVLYIDTGLMRIEDRARELEKEGLL